MSAYDDLQKMYRYLAESIEGGSSVDELVSRNLSTTITEDIIEMVYGTVEDQLRSYKEFQGLYRNALEDELLRGVGLSASRKREIRLALKENSPIDLNLLSSLEVRRNLKNQYMTDVLKVKQLFNFLGLPGISLPSSNPNTMMSRMAMVLEEGLGYNPIIDLLERATFSIDPLAGSTSRTDAMSSLRVGTTNLPSYNQLSENVARGGPVSIGSLNSDARVFFADTETTGVTTRDYVRSISVSERGTDLELGARFSTPEMQAYVSSDPENMDRIKSFGDVVIDKETRLLPEGPAKTFAQQIIDNNNIFDLTTETGRLGAKNYYTNLLTTLSEENSFFAAYNAQFDINMISRSARAMGVSGELIESFQQRMASGGAIDILAEVRRKLVAQASEEALSMAGEPIRDVADAARRALINDTIQNLSIATGEAVKPFGLENIIQSTNFLKLLETGSEADQGLLRFLADTSASHVDITDRMILDPLLRHMDNLVIDENYAQSNDIIKRARINTLASRALVPTVNIADPIYLSSSMYEQIISSDEALKKIEIYDEEIGGILKYDRRSEQFRVFDEAGGSTQYDDGLNRIRQTLINARESTDYVPGRPTIIGLGVNPIQSTNAYFMERLIRSDVAPTNQVDDIISALSATRNLIGFNYISQEDQIADERIRNLMRGEFKSISIQEREQYAKVLAKGGMSVAAMDPQARATFVGISTLMSSNLANNTELIKDLLSAQNPDMPQAVLETKIRATEALFQGISDLFSETGIFSALGAKDASVQNSVLRLNIDAFRSMSTIVDGQKTAMFAEQDGALRLSTEFINSNRNIFRFSVVNSVTVGGGVSEPMVNIVFGGRLATDASGVSAASTEALRASKAESDNLFAFFRNLFETTSDEDLLTAGVAESTEKLAELRGEFEAFNVRDLAEKRKAFRAKYRERGVVLSTIKGDSARKIIAMINPIASGIDADTVAVQKGMTFSVAHVSSEGIMTFVPRQANEQTEVAARLASNVSQATPTEQLDNFGRILNLSTEQEGFLDRMRQAFDTAILNNPNADRADARRIELNQKLKKIKPKVYMGVLALGALSAGYYLGRKEQENDLYNEVMERQPYSSPAEEGYSAEPQFRRFNQQSSSQYSYRRDPLVTAGVVGGLDRNKISHYKMGSDKYGHLYGN